MDNGTFDQVAVELADRSIVLLVEMEQSRIDRRAGRQLVEAAWRREPVHSVAAGADGCWIWFDRRTPVFLAGSSQAPVKGTRLAYAMNCGVAIELVFCDAAGSISVLVDAIRDQPTQLR